MALTEEFNGNTLPDGWSFESPLAGGSYSVSDGRVHITLPDGTAYDSIFNTGSADNVPGVTHEIPDHGGDIDIAIQCDTDVGDKKGHGINLLCKGSGNDACRFTWYHADNDNEGVRVYGYARAGGSGAQIGNSNLSTFMTGIPSWLRIKYTAATSTWEAMHSSDGFTWLTFMSGERAFTATTFKVGYGNNAATPTGGTIRINQVVDVIAVGTEDLRAHVPLRTPVPVVTINGADGQLPAEFTDASEGMSSIEWTEGALRFSHDASQDASEGVGVPRAAIRYTGTNFEEWGMVFKVSNPVGNASTYFVAGCAEYVGGQGLDQYSFGGGYALEIQSGAVRRPIRVDDDTDATVSPVPPFSTGLNEVPYCWLKDLTGYNMRDGDARWFRMERLGRRFRVKEWADGEAEPDEWNLYDGQDEVNDQAHGPTLSLSHNAVKTGSSVFDVFYLQFYKLVPAIRVKQGGSWKEAEMLRVKQNDEWHEVVGVKKRGGGDWSS